MRLLFGFSCGVLLPLLVLALLLGDARADLVRSDKAMLDLASHVRDLHHGGDATATFRHHDADGDGKLTKTELQRMLGHHKDIKGFFSKSIKGTRLARALDHNDDGYVDESEWRAGIPDGAAKPKQEL
jgi:hypothetical protein